MALNQTCHLDTWYGWHCRTCGRIVGSQSFPITISALNGDTKVMQVYAEALVEDLRATIAKSGGDFVELKSRQHQKEGYKKVRVRAQFEHI